MIDFFKSNKKALCSVCVYIRPFLTMSNLSKMNYPCASVMFCIVFISTDLYCFHLKVQRLLKRENYKDDNIKEYFIVFPLWAYFSIYRGAFKFLGLKY